MTKSDVTLLFGDMNVYWPGKVAFEDATRAVELWHDLFKGVSRVTMQTALKRLVHKGSAFPPSAAQVMSEVANLYRDHYPEAEYVLTMIRRSAMIFGRSREDEAMQSLTNDIGQVVTKVGWSKICSNGAEEEIKKCWESLVIEWVNGEVEANGESNPSD